MKVTPESKAPAFHPVAVTFLCETQEELDALGALFNSVVVLDAIAQFNGADFRSAYVALAEAGAQQNTDNVTALHRLLSEHRFIKQAR